MMEIGDGHLNMVGVIVDGIKSRFPGILDNGDLSVYGGFNQRDSIHYLMD